MMEVAVGAMTGAMTPLLEKLGNLLVSELTLDRRVSEDVVALEREMRFMDAALRQVAQVPPDRLNEGVALWAAEVRELSYDMEDAVDAFVVRVGAEAAEDPEPARRGLGSQVRVFLGKTARLFGRGKALHQVAAAIGDAQSLAKRLGDLRHRYGGLDLQGAAAGAGAGAGGDSTIDPRLMAMFGEVEDLVGVDGSRDELIRMLSDVSKNHVRTVSIAGFGGLGKTTLAKAVYDRAKAEFDCGAFVSVSRSPDIRRIFKKMLYELDEEKYADIEADKDAEQLIRDLRGFLQDKRYLIVIDDIWDEETWKFIKLAFPENNNRSRLITTTRIQSVAEACCSSFDDSKICRMEPLSETDSQKLFYTRIFHRADGCPPELEQLSKDILKKCGGVPLAIISIASVLASRNQIKAKDQWYTLLKSIGHGLTDSGDMKDMQTILSFSYYDLPSHLKTCLLYLSIFPEDYEIRRSRLIWRWIAEGFVQPKNGGDNLFDLGGSYFMDLINRSMIQPMDIDVEGRVLACRVHDMVLDLIRSISGKENFVTVWDGPKSNTTPSKCSVRRLSILQNTTTPLATMRLSQVRSFTLFNPAVDSMPPLSEFQVLRVLDLEGCHLKKCGGHLKLRHLGNLAHLRYLGLRRTYIRELPMEIGKLGFLQTLDVRGANGLQELPTTIARLWKLMCLHLDWNTRIPNGLGNLTSLQELTGLRVGHDSAGVVTELGSLTGLRVLTMRWEETDSGEALVQSLGELCELQSLDVYVNGGRGELMRGWAPPPALRRIAFKGPSSTLPALPAWVNGSTLPRLTSLDLWVGQVRRGDLDALGALPSLLCLRLRAAAGRIEGRASATERLAVGGAGAFPCARECTLLHFATVAPSVFPRGAMPMVRHLKFSVRAWDFASGGGVLGLDDLRMGHLPSLEEVSVELWYRRNDGGQAERVAAALRHAAHDHPNRPTMRINKRFSRPGSRGVQVQ